MTDQVFECVHLKPYLDLLTRDGAEIVAWDRGWTLCPLNLVLSKGPTIEEAKALGTLPEAVELWFNDDGHYALENGLFCNVCKVGLSWPRRERPARR